MMRNLPTTEYDLLDLFDRLEELREDMDDLNVRDRAEVDALLDRIRQRLDALEAPAQS